MQLRSRNTPKLRYCSTRVLAIVSNRMNPIPAAAFRHRAGPPVGGELHRIHRQRNKETDHLCQSFCRQPELHDHSGPAQAADVHSWHRGGHLSSQRSRHRTPEGICFRGVLQRRRSVHRHRQTQRPGPGGTPPSHQRSGRPASRPTRRPPTRWTETSSSILRWPRQRRIRRRLWWRRWESRRPPWQRWRRKEQRQPTRPQRPQAHALSLFSPTGHE